MISFNELKILIIENTKLKIENDKLKEILLDCPILGEVHADSNSRFLTWNLEHDRVLKEIRGKIP